MEIVRCENVTKVYGAGDATVRALDGVSLSLESGSFTAVTGASGSGKSTLLHILGAVDAPTSGSVVVCGTDVTALRPAEAAAYRRQTVGLVYQFFNLMPTLSVRENIALPVLLGGGKPAAKQIEALAEALGIGSRLDAFPPTLSGGQQQRAAIARALLYEPALLLLDEPTGSLDRENADALVELLISLHRTRGQAILLVTHDAATAAAAERILVMRDGRIVSDRAAEG